METQHERRKRVSNRIIWGVLAVAAVLGAVGFQLASHGGPGLLVQSNGNEVGGSFRLESLGESTVTEGDFHGTWMLVWFFDTNCPEDRCQPVLKSMEQAYQTLHAEGIRVSPLAVSLNPFDENEAIRNYVIPVAPHVMPFTGTPNMIKAMTAEYHAPDEKEGDHYVPAPRIVIMDPNSRYAGTIDATGDAAALIARLRQLAKR
ncbi:electron transport transmembrane protein Sco1/SenC/PrrC [Gluconobacter thailandicus F149-1 = NBRC 100600]|uniref:Thioredoxin domain-containing protein n=1 Tax=Gluconobacter thailandicus NBRC 3257 TaxID=1381097 RepID=A0ABQ0IY96_GLUTH|nr:SCO family protein [Gluconobacter thailandicus]KXV53634.1 hypothetical protein AD946_07040 [Gluconobacter thailandicus]GAC88533.1 hypothetical protein NBRC3255_2194 [Gluconobacter thailandicus NBRC 3255]GAD27178.1 hypothetical protein NBRC3257_2177 [Gluconobacter thailandicus NBRC 3257]GAN94069.1 electron transport transmembrane protein Sco1/SenC/PrrC [Gluconobacter thailandicus F149-1 = NBRC 100600]GBR58192.1 hypothetical protein AA100600_0660 [Gluconobacter thailandicus F149-1 = NBRC 1006